MSDKPVISTETDRMDKGMLDQVRAATFSAYTWLMPSSSSCILGHWEVYTTRIQT